MHRRNLLGVLGMGGVVVAGCLHRASESAGDDESPAGEQAFEGCDLTVVYDRRLPDEVVEEVDAAFDDEGGYQSDGELYWEQIQGEAEALYRDGAYYEPIIESGDGSRTLRFEETTVEESFSFRLYSHTDDPVRGSVTAEGPDGTVLEEEAFDVEPGVAGRTTIELDDVALGEYDIHLHIDDGEDGSESLTHRYHWNRPSTIAIEGDDIDAAPPADDGGLRDPCSWDGDGQLRDQH